MNPTHYLAVDLGADSGRVMLGSLEDEKLALEEIHRFENRVTKIEGHLHWDLEHLEREIFGGINLAAQRGQPISGLSVDSWAVDYVLLDRMGRVKNPPYCYRDARNLESSARVLDRLPFRSIYDETGIQFLPFNTLYQLAAEDPRSLEGTSLLLTIADYFNFRLSGVAVIEESMASATQLYNPRTGSWSKSLISGLGLTPDLFPPIVPSGKVLGPVTGTLQSHASLAAAKVVASCSHDTGAAVAAVPFPGEGRRAYLSSGTWSLLGAELEEPVLTDAAREAGFTNEVGLGRSIRFLKNITGLFLLQECNRAWKASGQAFTFEELKRLAMESGPARAHLSLQDPRFITPGDMPGKIAAYLRETNQPAAETPGQITRIVLESLALEYAITLRELEKLTGAKMDALHIVGGGSRNELLNQLTADATGLPVMAGPTEATAIGNILIQARSLGHLASKSSLRLIVEASFPTRLYQPQAAVSPDIFLRYTQLRTTTTP